MADTVALRKIGFGFFAIATSVILMTAVVVKSHMDGRLSIEVGARATMASMPITVR
jgi:hypothetical protein